MKYKLSHDGSTFLNHEASECAVKEIIEAFKNVGINLILEVSNNAEEFNKKTKRNNK